MINQTLASSIEAIEKIVQHVESRLDGERREAFEGELAQRGATTVAQSYSDAQLLQRMAHLIAYSMGARANLVRLLLKSDGFRAAFANWDPPKTAALDPNLILDKYWHEGMSVMRFRRKIGDIIRCAQILSTVTKQATFREIIDHECGIPSGVQSRDDVDAFWNGFDKLIALMEQHKMPFFRKTTTLLHLLSTMGYYCLKPDRIVMRVLGEAGVVARDYKPKDLRTAVVAVQDYCLQSQRGLTPFQVDLYLLTAGGMTATAQYQVNRPRSSLEDYWPRAEAALEEAGFEGVILNPRAIIDCSSIEWEQVSFEERVSALECLHAEGFDLGKIMSDYCLQRMVSGRNDPEAVILAAGDILGYLFRSKDEAGMGDR